MIYYQKSETKKLYGKPVGNDREKNKVTFVTKYGLEKAKQELDKAIKQGIKEIEDYKTKAEFLKALAMYIQNRER